MIIKGLIALAFGTLGLGITEFVAMGLLPYIANDFNLSLDEAGHTISFYALGVACGAFSLLFLRKYKLKYTLIGLIIIHILGNAATATAQDFTTLMIARFCSGLPHGCYFGVGSIIATRIASKGKDTGAIAIMGAGMTIANVFGVPLGTFMASTLSWRSIFFLVTIWGLLVLFSAVFWIKDVGAVKDNGFKGQFTFLKYKSPWLILGATLFSNAGIFCLLSYLSPLLTKVTHIPLNSIAFIMVVMGICMVLFNLVSGKLCDKLKPGKVSVIWCLCSTTALISISLLLPYAYFAIPLICLCGGLLFATSAPFQNLILKVSEGGQLLGASCIQAAFNLGNALGALVGGIPFILSLDLKIIPLLGSLLTIIGLLCIFLFARNYEFRIIQKIKEDKEFKI